jgi:hypothetical protein
MLPPLTNILKGDPKSVVNAETPQRTRLPQENWPIFTCGKAAYSSAPGFTMRYPPELEQGDWRGPLSASPAEHVRSFHFTGQLPLRYATLEITRSRLTEEQLDSSTALGVEGFAELTGRSLSELMRGSFCGYRTVAIGRRQAADLYLAMTGPREGVWPRAVFGAVRSATAGDTHFLFAFLACYILDDARGHGYTSDDNPFLTEFGAPSIDSIRFLD